MKRVIIFILLLFNLNSLAQIKLSANEIVMRAQEAVKVNGLIGISTLTIIDENGNRRVREIAQISKFDQKSGSEKRLIRFLEPPELKGAGLLTFDHVDQSDDVWLYMPSLRRSRRIVSTDKAKNFMGSEFTYADMTPPSLDDFNFKLLQEQKIDGTSCYQIEWLPLNEDIEDENGFSRRITFLGKDDFMIRKSFYFDIDNQLHKELIVYRIKELDPVNHRFRAVEMEMINHLNGRRSVLLNTKLEYNPHIEDKYFTIRYLERE